MQADLSAREKLKGTHSFHKKIIEHLLCARNSMTLGRYCDVNKPDTYSPFSHGTSS